MTDTDSDGVNDTQVILDPVGVDSTAPFDSFGSRWNTALTAPGVKVVYGHRSQGGGGASLPNTPFLNTDPHHCSWTVPLPNMFLTSLTTVVNDTDSLYCKVQPMVTPLFAPGVLFNTIKSGVACDYPLMTDNVNRVLATVSSSLDLVHAQTAAFWMIGGRSTATASFVIDTANNIKNWFDNTGGSVLLGSAGKTLKLSLIHI